MAWILSLVLWIVLIIEARNHKKKIITLKESLSNERTAFSNLKNKHDEIAVLKSKLEKYQGVLDAEEKSKEIINQANKKLLEAISEAKSIKSEAKTYTVNFKKDSNIKMMQNNNNEEIDSSEYSNLYSDTFNENIVIDEYQYIAASKKNVSDLLGVGDVDLMIERAGKNCHGFKKLYNYHVEIYNNNELITSILLFYMIYFTSHLKSYAHLKSNHQNLYDFCVLDVIKYLNETIHIKKRLKTSNPGLGEDDILFFKSKQIKSSYKEPQKVDSHHLLNSKKVVITGIFEKFPYRDEMAKWLHDVGADVNTSISSKTDYVIVGRNAGPKKLQQIESLKTKVLTEEDFIALFPNDKPKYS
jgi:NAD-dependent DNA ligase